jgi:hypothetical protein
VSRAIQAARERIRAGVPPGLAIHQAAEEFGVPTGAIARGINSMRRRAKAERRGREVADTTGAWWNR